MSEPIYIGENGNGFFVLIKLNDIREKKQINDNDLYKTQNYIFTNKLLMEIKKFVDTIYNNSYIEKY